VVEFLFRNFSQPRTSSHFGLFKEMLSDMNVRTIGKVIEKHPQKLFSTIKNVFVKKFIGYRSKSLVKNDVETFRELDEARNHFFYGPFSYFSVSFLSFMDFYGLFLVRSISHTFQFLFYFFCFRRQEKSEAKESKAKERKGKEKQSKEKQRKAKNRIE